MTNKCDFITQVPPPGRALAELLLHLILRADSSALKDGRGTSGGKAGRFKLSSDPIVGSGSGSESLSGAALNAFSRPLPPPIIPGNWAPRAPNCFLRDALGGAVSRLAGFEFMGNAAPESSPRGQGQHGGGASRMSKEED